MLGSDIVCCCTDARDPVLFAAWLSPGMHVSSVGTGAELDAAIVSQAAVFVESRTALLPPPAGAAELQGRDADSVTEVGGLLAGRHPGRASDDAITVYKSMGHAVEDAAASALVYRRAVERGAGTAITL